MASQIDGFELSPLQRHAWRLAQATAPRFGVHARIAIRGPLRLDRLEAAVAAVTRAHEILRTSFPTLAGLDGPVQAIASDVRLTLSRRPPARGYPSTFDAIEGDVPWHVWLESHGATHATVTLRLPAMVGDTRTVTLWTEAVARTYEAAAIGGAERGSGADAASEVGAAQYADVSSLLQDALREPAVQPGPRFWRGREAARDELFYEQPRERSGRGCVSAMIPAARLAEIDRLCGWLEISRESCLFGACLALVQRAAGDRMSGLNVWLDGRAEEGLHELLGPLTRAVPLALSSPADVSVATFLRDARDLLARAVEKQHYYDPAAAGAGPLGWGFCYDRVGRWRAADVTFEIEAIDARLMDDRGVLFVRDRGDRCRIDLSYARASADGAAVSRLLEHLLAALGEMAQTPSMPLRAVSGLGYVEQQRVLLAARGAARPSASAPSDGPRQAGEDDDISVLRVIEARVAASPDAIAIVHGDAHVSYRLFWARVERLARTMRERGVRADRLVALCLERGVDMVVAMLATLKAGGAYVPLELAHPDERLRYMLADARPVLVIVDAERAARMADVDLPLFVLDEAASSLPNSGASTSTSASGRREAASADDAARARADADRPAQLAYVIYTSGSTGNPKGAAVTRAGLANHMAWFARAFALTPGDVVLQKTPVGFDASVWEFYAPLMCGGRLVLAPPDAHQDPETLLALTVREQVTLLQLVPSLLALLLEWRELSDCRALRLLCCGGEPLPAAAVRAAAARLPAELVNLYGPTESTIDATWWRGRALGDAEAGVPIGHPIDRVEAFVANQQTLCPAGAPGELWLGGDGLARGYVHQPALTAARFVPHPWSDTPGARLYRTGDRVRLRGDGQLEFLGRGDRQIKLRGHRIELPEVEAALQQTPGVRAAVALVRLSAAGQQELVAYVSPAAGATLAAGAVRDALAARVPAAMVPARVHVLLPDLPRLTSGKVDRATLEARASEPADAERPYVEPATPVERLLAELWQQLLRVPRVGRDHNFFELGGDSILSIQVVARASKRGVRLTPAMIFEHQTLANVAAHALTGLMSTVPQAPVIGDAPLSPMQQRFFDRGLRHPHRFNQAILVEAADRLDPAIWRRTVDQLLTQHDALRARFVQDDAGWRQQYDSEPPKSVRVCIDLSRLPAPRAALRGLANAVQRSLHITQGPLCRIATFDLGPNERQRLLLVAHHLVVDAVSWRILLDDLTSLYTQLRQQGNAELPPKSVSFAEWARRLHALAASDAMAAERAFWLRDEPARGHALPRDLPDGLNSHDSQRHVRIVFETADTHALLRHVLRGAEVEMADVLLGTAAEALTRWRGGASVAIDVEGHGRDVLEADTDVGSTIGWFTTIYPLSFEAWPPHVPWRVRLGDVHARRAAIPRKGAGYGLLRHFTPHADALARAEVSFNYLGQLDQIFERESAFLPGRDDAGEVMDRGEAREYVFDIAARVQEDRLVIDWRYSAQLHHRDTVGRLARDQEAALLAIVRDTGTAAEPVTERDAVMDEELAAIAAELGLEG